MLSVIQSSSWPRGRQKKKNSRGAGSEALPWRCGAGLSSEQLRAARCGFFSLAFVWGPRGSRAAAARAARRFLSIPTIVTLIVTKVSSVVTITVNCRLILGPLSQPGLCAQLLAVTEEKLAASQHSRSEMQTKLKGSTVGKCAAAVMSGHARMRPGAHGL